MTQCALLHLRWPPPSPYFYLPACVNARPTDPPCPAQAAAARRLLGVSESPLGRRALQGERTFEVDIGQGDLWAYQARAGGSRGAACALWARERRCAVHGGLRPPAGPSSLARTTHPPPAPCAAQSETTVSADIEETESGGRKVNLGVARGRAFAANGLECLTKDCEEPVAEVGGWWRLALLGAWQPA